MNKIKEFFRWYWSLILIFVIITSVIYIETSCKIVTKEVDVTVVDSYYRGAIKTAYSHNPSVHKIYVKYKDEIYFVSGADNYHKYSNSVGKTVKGVYQCKEYFFGEKAENIIDLK